MNDIERARINRWFNQFSIEISANFPRGILGWIWFSVLCTIPVGLLVVSIKINDRIARRIARGGDSE